MGAAAFFDFDGTLYDGHVWHDISNHYRERRRRRALVWIYLAAHIALFPLNLLKLLDDERFYSLWARDLAWFLGGLSRDEGRVLQRHLLDSRILPGLRTDALERLRRHQHEGHLVMLVSGCFAELLRMLAGELGVRHAIGTGLAMDGDRYTGRATGPMLTGRGKVQAVEQYARQQGLEIDWGTSYAYGDSRTDIPLLQRVGHPVAVCPDKVLAAYALAHGWEVLASPPGP
jgi:HAD superfamily hydrolase (TIGR01490 family)